LEGAPDRIEVLKKFLDQLDPVAWVGSFRASTVESNAKLLDDLAHYPDRIVVEFISAQKLRLAEAIKEYKHTDDLIERERDERFE
jgi:hypothetical protein